MKAFLSTLALALFLGLSVQAQTSQVGDGPMITVEKDVYDYGTIKKGANGNSEFTIKNTGSEPLIISNAKGSCGCTVPEWPKQPIMPGESAVMTVKYDTKRVGAINKSVTITSNATNEATKVVRIKGTVMGEEDNTGTAPVRTPAAGAPINNQ